MLAEYEKAVALSLFYIIRKNEVTFRFSELSLRWGLSIRQSFQSQSYDMDRF